MLESDPKAPVLKKKIKQQLLGLFGNNWLLRVLTPSTDQFTDGVTT